LTVGVLVTGGAGFIGSNLLSLVVPARDYRLEVGDGACPDTLHPVMERHRPQVVLPFAAESQVDRSIRWPGQFVQTDVMGTCHLLALDCSRIRARPGWQPQEALESGLARTVRRYLDHPRWVARAREEMRRWTEARYAL
jgi:dTDP-D-glucose 4,6-dehydratase